MKNKIKKIVSVAMAFTIIGTGTAITKSVSPSSVTNLTIANAEINSKKQQIYDALIEFGFSKSITIGILGNIQQECYEYIKVDAKKGQYIGICQWGSIGKRNDNLKAFCKNKYGDKDLDNNWKYLDRQIEFMKAELLNDSAAFTQSEKGTSTNYKTKVYNYLTGVTKGNGLGNSNYDYTAQDNLDNALKAAELWLRIYEGVPEKNETWNKENPRYKYTVDLWQQFNESAPTPPPEQNVKPPYTGIVVTETDPSINVRKKPAKNSLQVGSIAYGKPATILEITGNWGRIEAPVEGWVCLDFIKTNASEIFNDVNSGEWYVDAINYVLKNNIMVGKGADKNSRKILFGTSDTLTRAECVTVIYNMENQPDVTYKKIFDDVPDGEWYSKPITWAYQNGIVYGYDEKIFGLNDKFTKEHAVQMLFNYEKNYKNNAKLKINNEMLNAYTDANEVSDWAKEAMKWALTNGITSGTVKNQKLYLEPKKNISRAEWAKMIKIFCDKYKT